MERHYPITDPDAGKATKCSRTACQNPGDNWVHAHLGGNYCTQCAKKIESLNQEWVREHGPLFDQKHPQGEQNGK